MALLLILIALGLNLAMAGAWAIGHRPGRPSWTDAIWSYAVGVDDPCYAELRRQWGERFAIRLLLFPWVQAAAGWLLAHSILLAARNPAPVPAWSAGAGVLVLLAVVGEAIADAQSRAYKGNPMNRGRVCDRGRRVLSRHPDYFCEWLGLCAYALIVIGANGSFGWGWLALIWPAFMYGLFVHVSGIPPLEANMPRSRGENLRSVQRRVRVFWPLPIARAAGAGR